MAAAGEALKKFFRINRVDDTQLPESFGYVCDVCRSRIKVSCFGCLLTRPVVLSANVVAILVNYLCPLTVFISHITTTSEWK